MQNIILNMFGTLSYPPTEDQLRLVGFLAGNIWILRFLSLFCLVLALFFWYKVVYKIGQNRLVSVLSCLIIFLTPIYYILWWCFPFDCLKILGLVFLVYILFFKNKNWLLIIASLCLIVFPFLITKERSSLVHKLNLNDAKLEVLNRFAAEDSLINPVKVPLKIKRIVYNKYFFEYKELINEVIPFFDVESLFFQEIHPLEQKSVVIFVWPEIFLLIGGIYLSATNKDKKMNGLLLMMLGLALVDFLIIPFGVFRKFEVILFPLSLLMAMAVNEIFKTRQYFSKFLGGSLVLLSFYGLLANFVDLNKRPDFWLDNRPYFYQFVFRSIENRDWQSFDKIHVTTLVGDAKKYCSFYLKNCDSRFVFESFELINEKPEKNSIYAGFSGEFIGSDFKNNVSGDWLTLARDKGFTNIETEKLRDTIAYKFGNDVLVGESK